MPGNNGPLRVPHEGQLCLPVLLELASSMQAGCLPQLFLEGGRREFLRQAVDMIIWNSYACKFYLLAVVLRGKGLRRKLRNISSVSRARAESAGLAVWGVGVKEGSQWSE